MKRIKPNSFDAVQCCGCAEPIIKGERMITVEVMEEIETKKGFEPIGNSVILGIYHKRCSPIQLVKKR